MIKRCEESICEYGIKFSLVYQVSASGHVNRQYHSCVFERRLWCNDYHHRKRTRRPEYQILNETDSISINGNSINPTLLPSVIGR